MQHVPIIESAKHAFRATICPACPSRPAHSERLGPLVARACEGSCSLFLYAGKLKEITESAPTGMPIDYEHEIRTQICNGCCAKPTHGDYCTNRLNCSCALACFATHAAGIIEGLVHAVEVAQRREEQSRAPSK